MPLFANHVKGKRREYGRERVRIRFCNFHIFEVHSPRLASQARVFESVADAALGVLLWVLLWLQRRSKRSSK